MCETKTVLVTLTLILQVSPSFCIYQAHTEIKLGQNGRENG